MGADKRLVLKRCKIDFIDKFVRADYFMGGLMATLMETECKIYKGID